MTISRGQLRKVLAKVSDSLLDPYEQLLALLPHEDRLNVDETGHKDNGKRLWTWCFRASLYTVFKISPSRGSEVLLEVLGEEFNGLLGCDYFGAYRKYMRLNENVVVQFCLAHFIRDVKFLAEHPKKKNREHGERLLEHLRKLFRVIHRRDEYPTETGFRNALKRIRGDLVYDAIMNSPGRGRRTIWEIGSVRIMRASSPLSRRRVSNRQTTWPNEQLGLWPFTAE